ncbi:RES family NAD+ phosphorylase [Luteimonas sp. R10]|uniref:RES family NAD+ phosphorylase n=1 Tax=Luteimonas sp. R10 TaxID=3108176 RepID=UPI003092386A|nr:RES family NAD+ phosphorylase [Luteimonas sp. R10]
MPVPNAPDEADLDEALEESFPASDPPALTTSSIATTAAADPRAEGARIAIYRLVALDDRDAPFDLQGPGSAGRWTSAGTRVLYAAASPAGALLEFLAHLSDDAVPDRLLLASAEVEGGLVRTLTDLPPGWNAYPYRPEVQRVGDAWAAARDSLLLRVPSALCRNEFNYLLNADHADAARVRNATCAELTLDSRLCRRR